MRKRILSTLTSGTSGLFASRFAKYARLAKSAKLTRFARPAKFASTLLAAPLATLLCGALFGSHSAYALEAPTITLSISSALVTNDNSTLVPTAASGNSSHYYIPVTIETTNADTYSVNISSNNANLTAAGTSFVIAPANSEGQTLANLTNQWGFRSMVFASQPADPDAEFGSTVYKPVTTAGQSIVADEPANASQVLMLDFGAGVTSAADSGKYTATVTLAAVATPKTVVTFQEFTDDLCNTATDEAITVEDSRDGKQYLVKKLADGKCWMVQNLSLGSKTETITLTSADSDVTSNWTLPKGITSFQSSNQNMAEVYVGTHQDATYNTGGYADTGVTCNDGSGNCNGTNSGNYYSWFAATAQGNGTTNGNNPSTGYANSATTSICPKGWNLPTSGDSASDFQKLYDAYGAYASFKNAWWPENQSQYTGALNTATLSNTTSSSYWWSRTVGNTNGSYDLGMTTSGVYPQSNGSRRFGYPVRCVYKMIPTFQDFSASDYSDLATGATTTLKDSRDGKLYLVAKLADGNVWMTQNLAIEGGTTLTSADSNVSSDYTLPASDQTASGRWNNNSTAYVFNGTHQDATYDTAVTSNNVTTANTGGYYSFIAATAGTGTGSSGEASSSICPKGWKLPTKAQYDTLKTKLGTGSTFNSSVFKPAFTGYCDGGNCPRASNYANYWSSTINVSGSAYSLYTDGSGTYTGNYAKYYGYSVRCIYDVPTFQDFSASDYDDLATGDTITLKDARDDKKYLVAKLADGNFWMVQNLAIAGGTTLTSSTSDVSSNYTLPSSSTSGFSDNATQYMYNGSHTDGTADSSTNTGGYYSFLTATANTGTGSSGDTTSSICPKGWKLPTTTQYNTLATSYGGTGGSSWDASLIGTSGTFGQTTFGTHFGVTSASALVGSYDDSGLNNSGSSGGYWSSSISNSAYGYRFLLSSSNGVRAQRSNDKRLGYSVRCVLLGQ